MRGNPNLDPASRRALVEAGLLPPESAPVIEISVHRDTEVVVERQDAPEIERLAQELALIADQFAC